MNIKETENAFGFEVLQGGGGWEVGVSEYPHIVKIHEEAAKINAGRKPKFGDKMRNLVAGELNPRRDAYFVKEKRATGRLNSGLWYTMTDRKGSFWDSCPKGLIFIDD